MSVKRLFAVFIASIALFVGSGASGADVQPIVQAVEAKYGKVETIQANFVQTSKSATFGEDKQSGEVFLKRPRKMFWNFTAAGTGGGKQFVTDGQTMWIYTAEDNQVIRYDDVGASQGSATAESMLQSLGQLSELFVVEVLPSETGHNLDLAPKKEGQVKKVHLEFDNDYVVQKVVITDSFDNVTELAFTAVQLNPTVPDSKFDFQIPPGAEVISAGGK